MKRAIASSAARRSARELGDATRVDLETGCLDAAVTRPTLHHLEDPGAIVDERIRIVRSGGRIVVADIVASDDVDEAALHNALATLRDPSHARMLPGSELLALSRARGLVTREVSGWRSRRTFREWARIVDDERRTTPLRTVMAALADAGGELESTSSSPTASRSPRTPGS